MREPYTEPNAQLIDPARISSAAQGFPPRLPPLVPPGAIPREPSECPPLEAATGKGRWSCTAKCNVQGIPGIAPDNLVSRVSGEGRGKTEAEACKNAQHDANQYVPGGAYKRHCQCDCTNR